MLVFRGVCRYAPNSYPFRFSWCQVVIDDAIPFDSAMNPLTARTRWFTGRPGKNAVPRVFFGGWQKKGCSHQLEPKWGFSTFLLLWILLILSKCPKYDTCKLIFLDLRHSTWRRGCGLFFCVRFCVTNMDSDKKKVGPYQTISRVK